MLNIVNHQGNANKSHSEILDSCLLRCYNKDRIAKVGEDLEKVEPLHTLLVTEEREATLEYSPAVSQRVKHRVAMRP